MRYIIWGTGKRAKNFVKRNFNGFFLHNDLVAFIDNSVPKNKMIINIPIIMPEDIKNIDFDKIIICSVYEEDIEKQIIQDLGINKEKIIEFKNVQKEIAHYYKNRYKLSEMRILLVGDGNDWWNQVEDNYMGLNIIGRVGLDDLSGIEKYKFDCIILLLYSGNGIWYHCDGISRVEADRNLINNLIERFELNKSQILTNFILNYFSLEQLIHTVEVNDSGECFYVIKVGSTYGLGACVLDTMKQIAYAKEKGYIPVVDMMTYPNLYLDKDEVGKVNAWEKFFEQPAGYGLEDAMNGKYIIGHVVANSAKSIDLSDLRMKKDLEDYVKKWIVDNFCEKKVLGVCFRGTDYSNMKPFEHAIQPSLDEMIEEVRTKIIEWGYDKIFLCTEVLEAVERFKEEFGSMVFDYPQERFPANTKYLMLEIKNKDNSYERGKDYWTAICALAECDSLIAGSCGAVYVALKLRRTAYRHTYIFDKGVYGIDDEIL